MFIDFYIYQHIVCIQLKSHILLKGLNWKEVICSQPTSFAFSPPWKQSLSTLELFLLVFTTMFLNNINIMLMGLNIVLLSEFRTDGGGQAQESGGWRLKYQLDYWPKQVGLLRVILNLTCLPKHGRGEQTAGSTRPWELPFLPGCAGLLQTAWFWEELRRDWAGLTPTTQFTSKIKSR